MTAKPGRPKSTIKIQVFSLRIEKAMHAELKKRTTDGRSINWHIVEALKIYLSIK